MDDGRSHVVERSAQVDRQLETWPAETADWLRSAISEVARDPTIGVASPAQRGWGLTGALMYDAHNWRVFYQVGALRRVIIVAAEPHPDPGD